MANFFIYFLLTVFISSFFINGFYTLIKGEWHVKPDGTKEWKGMIFNFWTKFLQTHTVELEYYKDTEWMKQFAKIKGFFKEEELLEFFDNGVVIRKLSAKKLALLFAYALDNGVNITINDLPEGNDGVAKGDKVIISAYTEKKIFKYPHLITEPLGLCIYCMSSVYGTILFTGWYFLAVKINEFQPMLLVKMNFGGVALIWALFCITLVYLNGFFYKISKQD